MTHDLPLWMSIDRAARLLDKTPEALRRAIERRARVGHDGLLEAAFDGVRARKLGGRWRVRLGSEWTDEKSTCARATSSPRPSRATRPEKE